MNRDLIVRSRRVVAPGNTGPAAVVVRQGVIVSVDAYDVPAMGAAVDDWGDLVVMPGLVDTHVHINEPGRTEWEGFASATRAAAAGGVTTLVEMPLNSIPATTSAAAYQQKVAAAQGQCHVDTGFWGGVVPGNAAELRGLWEAGAFGFKCFLVESGVAEFAHVTVEDLRPALAELAKLGAPLLVHAEVPAPIAQAVAKLPATADPRSYATWLASRPREAENVAIAMMLGLSYEYGVGIHFVHVSSSDALLLLKWARRDGLRITAETCPHYLTFAAEEIVDGATEFKCAPPIRELENRERLWAALEEGLLDCVVTDHSPAPPAMKHCESGDFLRAWGGIASLQLSLPAMWTTAEPRGFSLDLMAKLLCAGPARLAGLSERKGTIAPGCDGDFVVWNPAAEFTVEADKLHHRHPLTPYAGRRLRGTVTATYLRGEKIFADNGITGAPAGRILRRGQA
jgi:allantoinase